MGKKYLHFVAHEATLKSMSLNEVKLATSSDKTLVKAMYLVRTENWQEIKLTDVSDTDILKLQ